VTARSKLAAWRRPDVADLRAGWTLAGIEWFGMHVPRRLARRLSDLVLDARFERMGAARAVVAANMSRVLGLPPTDPLVRATTREAFALYGRYWYETFALRAMSFDEVDRQFRPTGVEHIDDGLKAGRGVILALPHMGNWDAAGHWLAIHGYPLVAVAEELRPPSLYRRFYRHRRALGMDIVPLQSGIGEQLARMLVENRVVALLADRNLGGRGVRVDFFGEPASLPAGPAMLARATGAALVPCAVFTQTDGWTCTVEPPMEVASGGETRADVRATTEALVGRFEDFVSSAPADWHMFQPVWDAPHRREHPSAPARESAE
jgi:KDO2-lipid IV(A) lauroyltransferase